ncbi:hypothetical protein R6Q57_018575, partial [Mikania cordata]
STEFRSLFWQEEDGRRSDSLPGRSRSHQDQQRPDRACSAGDPPAQGILADPSSRPPQGISKALVKYYQKFVDEEKKKEIKDILVRYDRTLLGANPRRCEPKKFGGHGARARFHKSYC